jgi:glycolate oxidase FAD binding subunit
VTADYPVDHPVDYPVIETVAIASAAQLRDALLELDAVRLIGSGSAQARLPAPDAPVTQLSTAPMNRILRLEADDLTCSVEPGLPRADLDAALGEHGLWLPCRDTGTLGGLFAADLWGAAAIAQPEPRRLLLGFSAILADGTRFKSGARVVKNVAGFDLPKLFVGSRGRLFAVTELHLKLRPRPPAVRHFRVAGLSRQVAIELVRRLRRARDLPQALCLCGRGDEFTVSGTIAGDPIHLDRWLADQRVTPSADPPAEPGAPAEGLESVRGQITLADVPDLLARLPAQAPFTLCGARFWTHLPPAAADDLLDALPAGRAAAEIGHGATDRRGRPTPVDPGVSRLEVGLRAALDPRGVLR